MSASVVLVGAGPRAVAVTARLVADHAVLAAGVPLVIHLIDAVELAAGRTWRTDQNRLLLNNTYCAETTVFADETVPTAGPTMPGPSLAEWAAVVVADPGRFEPWVVEEATRTRPWTFPSRAFQGVYFRWALEWVRGAASTAIDLRSHRGRVVSLADEGRRQVVGLADGRRIAADVVILTQGLLTTDAVDDPAPAGDHGLHYLSPGMPSERDWDALPAGRPVIIRGLGANFFDVLGLLFEERGGRYHRAKTGELVYRPSGREPRVIAGSRHGLPYRAKAFYPAGLPQPVELRRLSASREAELITAHGGCADLDAGALIQEVWDDLGDVYAAACRRTGRVGVFELEAMVYPAAVRSFDSTADWEAFLDDYLAAEIDRIRNPDTDPDKLVHRAMETARRRVSRLVLAQVFDPASVITGIKRTLWPRALVLASGPPPERLEQLVALRGAGLVEILGPGLTVTVEDGGYSATTAVPGQLRAARGLAEARMNLGNLRTTDDPLVRSMIANGQARYHRARGDDATMIETSTLDVTGDEFLLIDATGRPHPRRIVLGSPAGDVQWNAALGAVPHTADKLLVGAERAAAHTLRMIAGHDDVPDRAV